MFASPPGSMSLRRGPVRRTGDGYVVSLGDDESELVTRLVGELRTLLSDPEPGAETQALIGRLFPVAYPGDEEMEAEYQRLMRDELVQSKLAAFDLVDDVLAGGPRAVDEGRMLAFVQSVNSIRLVLGSMLEVSDDPDAAEVTPGLEDSPEYALYGYLSWILECAVQALGSAG